jgi:hypothetical protein
MRASRGEIGIEREAASHNMRAMTLHRASIFCGLSLLAASASGSGCGGDGGGSGPTYNFAWDWVGVVGTGQSLSVGANGTPYLATQQPYGNLKLAFGGATVTPPFDANIASLEMVPLTEPIRPTDPAYPSAYPGNLDGETPHTAMANELTALVMKAASRDYVTVHTVVGESGQPMTVIEKNPTNLPTTDGKTSGLAYSATLFEATAINRLAGAAGKSYGIGAIVITHGESDAGNSTYANDLFQLLTDYNTDLAAITGQTAKIPMFASQQNSVPTETGSVAVSALQVWKASKDHPGEIVCTGPKYQYTYASDAVHLNAMEYEKLGEKTAQIYFERMVAGNDWQPLQPTSGEVSGNTVTVHFHVPVPPLVLDDTLPAPHGTSIPDWAMGRGFEIARGGIRQTITAVELVGDDAVKITCANELAGAEVIVGYANTAEGGAPPAGKPARWGHLRDSDPFVGSVTMTPQPNWAIAFQMAVP